MLKRSATLRNQDGVQEAVASGGLLIAGCGAWGQIGEMRSSWENGRASGQRGPGLQAGQAMMDRLLPDGGLPRTLPYLLLSRDEAVLVQAALLPLQVEDCPVSAPSPKLFPAVAYIQRGMVHFPPSAPLSWFPSLLVASTAFSLPTTSVVFFLPLLLFSLVILPSHV